jgi:molybdenum cofactor guanylyltransferase
MTLSAAVLTGGASRRMGADKAMVDVAGVTLLERTLAPLRALAEDIMIVGARPDYARFGVRLVDDDFPGLGPLGGLATALRVARHEHTLVVACDMPLLSVALLRAMAAEPRDYDVLVPLLAGARRARAHDETVQPQPLHAIYARRCLSAILPRLEAGQLRVVDVLDDLAVRWLDTTWLQRFDPRLRSALNANTPAQLDEARRLLEAKVSVEHGV